MGTMRHFDKLAIDPHFDKLAIDKCSKHVRFKKFCFSKYLDYAYEMRINISALIRDVFRNWPL